MSLRWIIDIFTDTAAILNLLDLRSIAGCPGGTRLVFTRAFRPKRELHYIQQSFFFLSDYNLFLGKGKEKLARKARVNTGRVYGNVLMTPGHPTILLKSNKFNMAAVSVKRSIVLEYTHEAISVESERKLLKKRLVWLTGEFMREHVDVNSRSAKVIPLQQLQTWQIIVLIFCKLCHQWFKRKRSLNFYSFYSFYYFWEEMQSFICFRQHTVNEKLLFAASYKCCQQRPWSRRVLCI